MFIPDVTSSDYEAISISSPYLRESSGSEDEGRKDDLGDNCGVAVGGFHRDICSSNNWHDNSVVGSGFIDKKVKSSLHVVTFEIILFRKCCPRKTRMCLTFLNHVVRETHPR